MDLNNKLGVSEAISIMLIVPLAHLLVTLPKLILQDQGSSSILNIIFITLLALVAISLLIILYKNFKGMDILDISNYLFGKLFMYIVGIIYIAFFIFVTSLTLRNAAENLKTIYFNNTPIPYIVFFLMLGIAFINKYNFKTVIKTNLIILLIVTVALITLSIFSVKDFVPERLFPILGDSFNNTFVKGASNIFIFANITFLFFLMPLLRDVNKFNKISYIIIIISGLFILTTIGSLLLMFPLEISSNSNSPIYLQSRQITLGKFIQRVDAFYILVWIITILSYISTTIAIVNLIFKKIANIENKTITSYCFILLLAGLSLIYQNTIQIRKLDLSILKISSLVIIFGFSFTVLLLGNIKKKIKGDYKKYEQNT